mmetsp:Transcript_53570/g.131224  ORF Transcript_53570/g.131224 Transcript_53570/m.131224 type:complete len:130 (+) Transcript_53570:752-1141(+)
MQRIRRAIEAEGGRVVEGTERYVRAEFTVSLPVQAVDDFEAYLTDGDDTVQFRSARRGGPRWDGGANRRRVERIRKRCGFSSVPVLRGRTRVFGVIESPFDTFGPTTQQDTDDLVDMENAAPRRRQRAP